MDINAYENDPVRGSLILHDGLYYQRRDDAAPNVEKPWLPQFWSRLYDVIMTRWIFPRKLSGRVAVHNRYMTGILAELKNRRVLEIGTGSGAASYWLDSTNCYRGVDISPSLLQIAKKRFAGRGFADARFYAIDAVPLPFQSGSFDLCLCVLTLNFIADEKGLFAELYRVLGPEGEFVCCVPVPELCRKTVKIRGALRSEDALRDSLHRGGFAFLPLPYKNGALRYFKAVRRG